MLPIEADTERQEESGLEGYESISDRLGSCRKLRASESITGGKGMSEDAERRMP